MSKDFRSLPTNCQAIKKFKFYYFTYGCVDNSRAKLSKNKEFNDSPSITLPKEITADISVTLFPTYFNQFI